MSFVDRIAEAANLAGESIEGTLTKEFRAFAVAMGWPEETAAMCEVMYDSYEFCVIPSQDDYYEEVLDWELGTPDRPGLPAMIKFMNRLDEYSEEWAEAFFNTLDERGLI